jgi:hypothetical protein
MLSPQREKQQPWIMLRFILATHQGAEDGQGKVYFCYQK